MDETKCCVRRVRRRATRSHNARLRHDYNARCGWFFDDDEQKLRRILWKRNDREQSGRLRLIKGCLPGTHKRLKREAVEAREME